MILEDFVATQITETENEIPSFNQSFVCTEIISQLLHNEKYKPLVKLTLDIQDGITPDISVFPNLSVKPDFFRDISKSSKMPIIAVKVISTFQIQDWLEKAKSLVKNGVKAVWTVEPFTNTVFVTTSQGNQRFHNQEIETEGIKIDFRKIFSVN